MSSDLQAAVVADHVRKEYLLGENVSLQSTVRWLRETVTRRPREREAFAAVDDLSFTVNQGEAFAILGGNGSGKSTLSRIIAGITVPTGGEVRVRGRVLPLLGIGAGFNEALTAYENILLFGSLLGIPRDELIDARPAIVDFAEIDDEHMRTPVKRFSMGMKTRLSFATALRLRADVYIFDEVLAVADDHFKSMCLREIEGLVDAGRTILFISHELPLVRSTCTRGVWMQNGRLQTIGAIEDVARAYEDAELTSADPAPVA